VRRRVSALMESSKWDTKLSYYEILSVNPGSSYEDIKRSYQEKLLTTHPDKLVTNANSLPNQESFFVIREAWEVLRDPQKRKWYDESLKGQLLPFDGEIDLDEMNYDESTQTYHTHCRCNGEGFSITESQLEEGIDYVVCGTCSFMKKVLFQSIE